MLSKSVVSEQSVAQCRCKLSHTQKCLASESEALKHLLNIYERKRITTTNTLAYFHANVARQHTTNNTTTRDRMAPECRLARRFQRRSFERECKHTHTYPHLHINTHILTLAWLLQLSRGSETLAHIYTHITETHTQTYTYTATYIIHAYVRNH